MRRLAVILIAALAAAGIFAAAGGADSATYRVDAIFDNVAFLNEGQQVRIAGATVGKVLALEVTPDNKGRVEMEIEKEFAPFRSDADCTIQPQSLIGERFVQCVPGTPDAAPLPEEDGVATVPVANTHAPVDLDLILGTLDRPVRERLAILLGSLGAGLAGHGDDLGQAILRANPALQETRKVLAILERDRARLRQLIGDGDTVLHALAQRDERVAQFVRSAADVAETTGVRRERVAEAVRRLPGFLDEARPALQRLTTFARAGTPLMADLRRAGPGLADLIDETGTFARRSRPTLARLKPVLAQTRAAIPDVAPQTRRLARFARDAKPAGELVAQLLGSMKQQGALDGFMSFFYYASAAFSRFDRFSHILPAYIIGSSCALYSKTPVAGCAAKYAAFTGPTGRNRTTDERRDTPAPAAKPKPKALPLPSTPTRPVVPTLRPPKKLLDDIDGATRKLLDYLLG